MSPWRPAKHQRFQCDQSTIESETTKLFQHIFSRKPITLLLAANATESPRCQMTRDDRTWMELSLIIPTLHLDPGGSSIEDRGRFVVAGSIKGVLGGRLNGATAAPGAPFPFFDSRLRGSDLKQSCLLGLSVASSHLSRRRTRDTSKHFLMYMRRAGTADAGRIKPRHTKRRTQ